MEFRELSDEGWEIIKPLLPLKASVGRPRHGRPYRLDLETYKRMRSSVERFFAWLTNGFRRLAIRWEKLALTFAGFIQLACIIIYLRVFR
jgi:transposase